MESAQTHYEQLTRLLKDKHERLLLEEGTDPKKASSQAEKRAIEDARFVLPNACDTRMIVTMNARSLMNFFRHRLCNRAQWEIQQVALEMFRLVYVAAPTLFGKAGPSCLYGKCPEGKMSCGKQRQVRALYREMIGTR